MNIRENDEHNKIVTRRVSEGDCIWGAELHFSLAYAFGS